MQNLKSAIVILALSLSACSAPSIGSQESGLNGHSNRSAPPVRG